MAITIQTNNVLFKKQIKILIPAVDSNKLTSSPIQLLPANAIGEKFWSIDLGSIAFRKKAGTIPWNYNALGRIVLSYDPTPSLAICQISPTIDYLTINEVTRKIASIGSPTDCINRPVFLVISLGDSTQGDSDCELCFEYSEKSINF